MLKKKGIEPRIALEIGENASDRKTKMENFAKAFINEGVIPEGDIPKNPEFWKSFKQEYLTNKDNSLENWNRLTRFIPKEYMGQEKGQTLENSQNISMLTHIKHLRNGENIKLNPPKPKEIRQTTISQTQLHTMQNSGRS